MRQMILVGFLQAQNCTNFVGSWRHPEASPDFMSAEYYRRVGRVLEAGNSISAFSTIGWRCRTVTAATMHTPSPTASAA